LAYAVQADLNLSATRLIELTDSDAVPGVIDAAVMAKTETEARSIVDTYLAGSFTVPFTAPIPEVIVTITAWLWACRLYRHRETMDPPQSVKDDCAMAIAMLEKLAAQGAAALGLPVSASPGVPSVESSEPRGWTPRDQVVE
jgi:phage gp36-like protein